MMNYAEKELREAMAYLDQARANSDAIQAVQRALQLGEPVEVSFRTARHTVAALCPGKQSEKLLDKLSTQASERVTALEKQEVYWCQEVAMLDKARKLQDTLRDNPDASHASLEQQDRRITKAMWAANDEYMAKFRGQAAGSEVSTS